MSRNVQKRDLEHGQEHAECVTLFEPINREMFLHTEFLLNKLVHNAALTAHVNIARMSLYSRCCRDS